MATSSDRITIGELAARSGIATSALRFYEERGLIHAERSAGGQRRYARSTLRRVAFIRIARQIGLSLDEIGQALGKLPDERTPTKADWARLSRAWRGRIDDQIATLQRLRDDLTGCIGCGCLSLQRCRLSNPQDVVASTGTGPRYLLGEDAPPADTR